jgi:hypothetical protein
LFDEIDDMREEEMVDDVSDEVNELVSNDELSDDEFGDDVFMVLAIRFKASLRRFRLKTVSGVLETI